MFTPEFRKSLVEDIEAKERAVAIVNTMFGDALEALATLYRVSPVDAARITRELMDGFEELRKQHVGS